LYSLNTSEQSCKVSSIFILKIQAPSTFSHNNLTLSNE
jgi:hypothetical protein